MQTLYCSYADIVQRIGPQIVADLCCDHPPDDSAPDENDAESLVHGLINEAGALIRACCQGRYLLPRAGNGDMSIPSIIRLFAINLTCYALYARRAHCEVPGSVLDQRNQALEWLWSVQRGELGLGEDAEIYRLSQATASAGGGPRLFTRPGRGRI